MSAMDKEFQKWAGRHNYLPIVERDFYAVWRHAWLACADKADAELEPLVSGAIRDIVQDALVPNSARNT